MRHDERAGDGGGDGVDGRDGGHARGSASAGRDRRGSAAGGRGGPERAGSEPAEWGGRDLPTDDLERDLRDEVAFHMEARVRDNVARGMSPEDARAEAEARFGDRAAVTREMELIGGRRRRARRRRMVVGDARRDLTLAARNLRRRPGFAVVTVLTLALGIGAATAVFAAADRVLLRPVPGVRAPDSLVTVTIGTGRSPGAAFVIAHQDYLALRDEVAGVTGLAAAQPVDANVRLPGAELPRRVPAEYVSADYARVLGLEPALGRAPGPADRADPYVAMISHDLWSTAFGRSPGAVGAALSINGRDFVVVGVAPPGFRGDHLLTDTDLWVPVEAVGAVLPLAGEDALSNGSTLWLELVGRLTPGSSPERVRASLQPAAERLGADESSSLPDGALVQLRRGVGLSQWEQDQLGGIFRVLGGVVALLLLLACANAANLLLARVGKRDEELAIRRAIGAGRGRLARLLLAEASLLTLLAWGLGLALAAGAVRLFEGERFLAFMPPLEGFELNVRVLLFALGAAGSTGLLFGVVPSLLATRGRGMGLRSRMGRGRRRGPSRILVVAQVAISVVLVVGAGLLLDTVVALGSLELGFDPEAVVEASVEPGAQGWDEPRRLEFFRELVSRTEELPEVGAAGLAVYPVQGRMRAGSVLRPEGLPADDPGALRAAMNQTSPGFLEAAGLELLAGRDFRWEDVASESGGVAIVSETAARGLFPPAAAGTAVGRRIEVGYGRARRLEIVGVVRDARLTSVKDAGGALLLEPLGQPWTAGWGTLYARGAGNVRPDVGALHRLLRDIDPGLPFYDAQPVERRVATRLTVERVLARLTSVFAALALALAAVGLYGVLAIAVQSRTREMGIRLALGARPEQVRALVMGRGVGLAALGVVLGLAASTQATRLIESRLWGVRPLDPAVFAGAAAVLMATALVACWAPAVRATRVDPVEALAEE